MSVNEESGESKSPPERITVRGYVCELHGEGPGMFLAGQHWDTYIPINESADKILFERSRETGRVIQTRP